MSDIDELLLTVRHLYGAIDRFDAAAAERLKVDRSALRAINAMERGRISPGELGAALNLSSGSVTALLERLEQAGYVARTLSREDGRRRDAHLTDCGRDQADPIYAQLGSSIATAFSTLDQESLAKLIAGLATLAEAFDVTAIVSTSERRDSAK